MWINYIDTLPPANYHLLDIRISDPSTGLRIMVPRVTYDSTNQRFIPESPYTSVRYIEVTQRQLTALEWRFHESAHPSDRLKEE